MDSMQINLIRLNERAQIPQAIRPGDAGCDLCCVEPIVLKPFERALIPTGLALEISDSYAGFVLPRSGLAINHGFTLVNSPGLIDSNYRGEIKIIGMNCDPENILEFPVGARIAQLVIMSVESCVFNVVTQLNDTLRGNQGFGSSGV